MTKAIVLGRIGLVRSLGRAGVPVTVAQETRYTLERYSRYCREHLFLPHLEDEADKALEVLVDYGRHQAEKPVAFFNGESDVLLFSRNRDILENYYAFNLSPAVLIEGLVDKSKFAVLAKELGMQIPKTFTPVSKADFFEAAHEAKYPCLLKPIQQRLWHYDDVIAAFGGVKKAQLIKSEAELDEVLTLLPQMIGKLMVQEYIPGPDRLHSDFHAYFDIKGELRSQLVGAKIRTYPVHFGQGSYTRVADDPEIAEMCIVALKKMGFTGAANINLKRHEVSGKPYFLEINPRFSLWAIIGSCVGKNMPMLQYCDLTGQKSENGASCPKNARWIWLGRDIKAMSDYIRYDELTVTEWIKSFFTVKGRLEFHVLSRDDPIPSLFVIVHTLMRFINKSITYLGRRMKVYCKHSP